MASEKCATKKVALSDMLASKASCSSIASVGTVKQSKTRLLANNKSLALLLNKKKMEIRGLRDMNHKLGISIGQHKLAFKHLKDKLAMANSTLRSLQRSAPNIFQDISNLANRFEHISNTIAAVDVENIENISMLNNLNLTDPDQSKQKPVRKRTRVINKVRPMKYGLVLGNPVVSLHRLRPPASLVPELPETEGYSSDNEAEINDEEFSETNATDGPGNSTRSTHTSTAQVSPSGPHQHVADLTLSVPVLQSMNSAAPTKKRPRFATLFSPPASVKTQQEIQLTTPCRVVLEDLGEANSSQNSFSAPKTPEEGLKEKKLPSTEVRQKRRRGRPATKQRNAFSDGENGSSRKKMSEEELKRALTPLRVEIKLKKLNGELDKQLSVDLGKLSEAEAKSYHRGRKLQPPLQKSDFADSDSAGNSEDSDFDGFSGADKNRFTKVTKRYRPGPKSKKRAAKKPSTPTSADTKTRDSPLIKVKIWGTKDFSFGRRNDGQFTDDEFVIEPRQRTQELNNMVTSRCKKLVESGDAQMESEAMKTRKLEPLKNAKRKLDETLNAAKEKMEEETAKAKSPVKSMKLATNDNRSDSESASGNCVRKEGAENDDHALVSMELTSPDLDATYVVEDRKKRLSREKVKKIEPLMNKPGPKSRKLALFKRNVNPGPTTEENPEPVPEPSSNSVDEVTATVEPPKQPKKVRPMPLSKKKELGLLDDDELQIVEEKIVKRPFPVAIKEEKKTPEKSPELNNQRPVEFMQTFLRRISMEDPLEGTSRQHVYKKPNPVQPAQQMKKSLRLQDKKAYGESPLSDAPATDDDTWYPNGQKKK